MYNSLLYAANASGPVSSDLCHISTLFSFSFNANFPSNGKGGGTLQIDTVILII